MKAAAISPTKRKANRTSIAMARRMWPVTGRMEIVRMAETAAGAADVPAAGVIVDAAGAVDVEVDVTADAVGRAGEDTRNICLGFARAYRETRDNLRGHGARRGPFRLLAEVPTSGQKCEK